MSDHDPKKTLSEISHLFLSSIRDKQTNGSPMPRRTPPQAPGALQGVPAQPKGLAPQVPPPSNGLPKQEPGGPWSGMNIDLTPAELAHVGPDTSGGDCADESDEDESGSEGTRPPAPVTAVIAAHLNGRQFDRVKDYARHLAGQVGGRIGLIELDASEFRLMCFEPGMNADGTGAAHAGEDGHSAECFDPRQIAEAVEEMSWDVDRWLLLLPTPRAPEAKALLRRVDHWVLLTTCDHDGVVSGYRTLKGLVDASHQPRLTLALLDGTSEDEMLAVCRKLSGVCQQFLGMRLEAEGPVRRSYRISEHLALFCRPTRDKAQLAHPPHWAIVSEFLDRAREARGEADACDDESDTEEEGAEMIDVTGDEAAEPQGGLEFRSAQLVNDMTLPTTPVAIPAEPGVFVSAAMPVSPVVAAPAAAPAPPPAPSPVVAQAPAPLPPAAAPAPAPVATFDEVIDLPDDSGTADAVLSAVLRQNNGTYVECPVRAPMCGGVRVAVGRDRGVVLFAVAREGLGELRSIGQALRWLSDNRALLGMALPQFAIDTHQAPRLRLLVDHSDLAADALQPVLQSGNVTVQSYRKLRWGGRTGLLLDAA